MIIPFYLEIRDKQEQLWLEALLHRVRIAFITGREIKGESLEKIDEGIKWQSGEYHD